jgi:F0F1-type ATP synthase epsilon subunit
MTDAQRATLALAELDNAITLLTNYAHAADDLSPAQAQAKSKSNKDYLTQALSGIQSRVAAAR